LIEESGISVCIPDYRLLAALPEDGLTVYPRGIHA
jgi:hypothetical protein